MKLNRNLDGVRASDRWVPAAFTARCFFPVTLFDYQKKKEKAPTCRTLWFQLSWPGWTRWAGRTRLSTPCLQNCCSSCQGFFFAFVPCNPSCSLVQPPSSVFFPSYQRRRMTERNPYVRAPPRREVEQRCRGEGERGWEMWCHSSHSLLLWPCECVSISPSPCPFLPPLSLSPCLPAVSFPLLPPLTLSIQCGSADFCLKIQCFRFTGMEAVTIRKIEVSCMCVCVCVVPPCPQYSHSHQSNSV